MKKTIILLMTILGLSSCSEKKDSLIGLWDDIIKLSTKNVTLTAKTDSVTITTEGDWWWINSISFDDSTYIYYNRKDIDLESDSYSIKEDFFIVERRDKNTLFVKLYENSTNRKRGMSITLEAGDYFDYINITQAAD
ncbi:hypothetical protein ACT3CD_15300 [Geofilum sp. OHC36d9]|uniref:hypothetical protein n=1 Tax=Geofilum sp. OHC36d9 TaxID=3458413 RepID=UPI0040338799